MTHFHPFFDQNEFFSMKFHLEEQINYIYSERVLYWLSFRTSFITVAPI